MREVVRIKGTRVHAKTLKGIVGCFQVMVPLPQDLRETLESVTVRTRHRGFDELIYLT